MGLAHPDLTSMSNTCRILISILLSLGKAHGQAIQKEGPDDAESRFLQLIRSDTSSNAACLLPKDFDLGIENPDTGRIVLLKQGRRNLLIVEGTHRVYTIDTKGSGMPRRLDKSVFRGDNFETMSFLRKDTLFQYGGAGRWSYRDFITFFDEDHGGWELQMRSNGLANRWVPHAYSPGNDAMYLMGSRSVRHTDWKKTYRDSVYRFDFRSSRWETLGSVAADFPLRRRPVHREALIAKTPMGDLFHENGALLLVDLPGNRTAVPKDDWADTVTHILKETARSLVIHLNDTLHVLNTGEKGFHRRIRLSKDDMQPFREGSIYLAVKPRYAFDPWWFAVAAALSVALTLWMMARRSRARKLDFAPTTLDVNGDVKAEYRRSPVRMSDTHVPNPAEPHSTELEAIRSGLEEMRKHLSAIEWELLTRLARSTLAGKSLETEEVNKAIGVSNKDSSLQKSRRSVVIGRMNRIFTQCTGRPTELVIRERDAEEKRRYNYRLDEHVAGWLADMTDD